jgi:hypothetical protein
MRSQLHCSHAPSYLLALLFAGGCFNEVIVQESDAVTGEGQFFETDTTDFLPTTTATDGEPPIDPQDYCDLQASPEFAGVIYSCEGTFSAGMRFDYFGPTDIPLHSFLPCVDLSENSPKAPGYVYTCFSALSEVEFGPSAPKSEQQGVEACCTSESPGEAVDPFCRIDASRDMCMTISNQLNDVRKQLQPIPSIGELKAQLENLNTWLATSETQSYCAKTIGGGLVDLGDFDEQVAPIVWLAAPDHALDPDQGWPWFREIAVHVDQFDLAATEETGVQCVDAGLGGLQGGIIESGRLAVARGESHGEARVRRGQFSFREADCAVDGCAFELASLRVEVAAFQLDGARLTDVSAELVAPARGKLVGEVVRIPGRQVELEVRSRDLSSVIGGDSGPQVHRVRATGDVIARRTADGGFALDSLRVVEWPVSVEMSTDTARPSPAAR